MRRDFIKGTLADDVFNYHLYTHILSGEYAARAKDLRTYAATSKVPQRTALGRLTVGVTGRPAPLGIPNHTREQLARRLGSAPARSDL